MCKGDGNLGETINNIVNLLCKTLWDMVSIWNRYTLQGSIADPHFFLLPDPDPGLLRELNSYLFRELFKLYFSCYLFPVILITYFLDLTFLKSYIFFSWENAKKEGIFTNNIKILKI